MPSTSSLSRFAAVLAVSLAATSAPHPGSAPPSLSTAATAADHAPATAAPIVLAQFSPCPNRQCR
jgi:hypothetical protein